MTNSELYDVLAELAHWRETVRAVRDWLHKAQVLTNLENIRATMRCAEEALSETNPLFLALKKSCNAGVSQGAAQSNSQFLMSQAKRRAAMSTPAPTQEETT